MIEIDPTSLEGLEGIFGHIHRVDVDPRRLDPRQREAMAHIEVLAKAVAEQLGVSQRSVFRILSS